MSENILAQNMEILRRRYPELAGRLESFPERPDVCSFKARDGGVGYGLRRAGKITPLTDPVAPMARLQQQLDMFAAQLQDFTRPVLIVGLYPGTELLGVFNLSEQCVTPHCPQPIWVCVDSLPCFYGFLCSWDARKVIESARVTWFTKEQIPAQVEYLNQHPEFPHVFTMVSGAPEQHLNAIMPPLVRLVEERNRETERLKRENEEYYDALDDRVLAQIIAGADGLHAAPGLEIAGSSFSASGGSARGGKPSPLTPSSRPPRLMMPTCAWSTYVQHSARDTCAAFEQLGWQTRLLKMAAMLTPYHLARQINEFKPDVFLFIDHLRSEAEEIYPRNMMFVTWVQDELDSLFCAAAGRKLTEYAARGRRDLVVGYVERLSREFAYPSDRLVQLHIPANPAIFRKMELTAADRRRYGCDLAFMSNVSMPSDQVLERIIIPKVAELGISRDTCRRIHDDLLAINRAGDTMTDRTEFLAWLMQYPEFSSVWDPLQTHDQQPHTAADNHDQPNREDILRFFYWRLNDTIYRHTVLEWADELGLNMHLYGHGWENNPRFKKYARGILQHGAELNIAYQAAGFNLHLNIAAGMHQRVWEIITADARPLLRVMRNKTNAVEPPTSIMRKLAERLMNESSHGLAAALEEAMAANNADGALADWVFNMALAVARTETAGGGDAGTQSADGGASPDLLAEKVLGKIEMAIMNRPEWIIPDWDQVSFADRESFAAHFNNIYQPDR